MSDEPKTKAERYGTAAVSGRLRFRDNQLTDLDTLTAAGMAGVSNRLGIAIWRAKYANDRATFRHAQALLLGKVANAARRKHWREPPRTLKLLACRVFDWWMFGVCPVCTGRGFKQVEGQPQALSDEPCPMCKGDGLTPIERAVPVEHIGRCKDIATILAGAEDQLARAVAVRMRNYLPRAAASIQSRESPTSAGNSTATTPTSDPALAD